ncbi:MAG TPA: response regulator, partial [bacterium]|nr:response regulator [bacterium]
MSACPTVLVVEDNQDVREIITEFLSAYGFSVISAVDGKEGLDLFNKKSPDFVLADVLLPRTNGFQLCQTIKTGPRPVPVILMSALYKSRNLQQEGKVKYGADDYLIKPLDLMDLARRICKLLGIERPKPLEAPPPEPVVTETDVQPDVGLAVDDEGDLERTPIEQVIGWLFQQQSTGRLAIDAYGIVRTMYIKDGLPIFVQSTVREEGFAHLLLVDGKVTAEQLAEAELKARTTKAMLGK